MWMKNKIENDIYKITCSSDRVPKNVLNLAKEELNKDKTKIKCEKKQTTNMRKMIYSLSSLGVVLCLLVIILPFAIKKPNDMGKAEEYVYTSLERYNIETIQKYNEINETNYLWIHNTENRNAVSLNDNGNIVAIEEQSNYKNIMCIQYISKSNTQIDIYNDFSNLIDIWDNMPMTIYYVIEDKVSLLYFQKNNYDYYFKIATNNIELLQELLTNIKEA